MGTIAKLLRWLIPTYLISKSKIAESKDHRRNLSTWN